MKLYHASTSPIPGVREFLSLRRAWGSTWDLLTSALRSSCQ
jgi:hypothetical protein